MSDFAGSYNQHFDVVRADAPDLRDLAYRLRYQVYCIENRFENPARCRDRREIDDDDDRSVHTLLFHRRSGIAAGTARVILPRLDRGRPLPIQHLLGPMEQAAFGRLPLRDTGEVSRFAVSKEFRRRIREDRYADADFAYLPSLESSERRSIPHITFGLFRGVLEICLEYEIRVLAAVMEPTLLRMLARLGLHFGPIGPLVEYHGLRQPCSANITTLVNNSRAHRSLLWDYLEASGSTREVLRAVRQ